MYCNNCGKEISNNSQYCNFCGQTITLKNEILNDNSQVIHNTTNVIKCPVCHNYDQVAKVSAVYSKGVSQTSSSGSAVGMSVPFSRDEAPSVTYMPISMSGTSISELSLKLAPPPYPKKQSFGCYKAIMILGGLFVTWILIAGLSFSIFAKIDGFINSGLAIFLVIFCISCIVLLWVLVSFSFKRSQKTINNDFNSALEQYKPSYSFWNKCYYCFRDDLIFDPTAEDHLSAGSMFRF